MPVIRPLTLLNLLCLKKKDLIHYDTGEELDSRRFGMRPPDPSGSVFPSTTQVPGDPGTLNNQPPGHTQGNPMAPPTHHHPQPWIQTRTTAPWRTQATTPRHCQGASP